MQTYLVHMENPIELLKSLGIIGFFGFQLFIGVVSITFLFIPLICIMWAYSKYFDNFLLSETYISIWKINLTIGIASLIIQAIIAARYHKWKLNKMILSCILFPLYWILHSYAAIMAVHQLIRKPFYWNKTNHGISKYLRKI